MAGKALFIMLILLTLGGVYYWLTPQAGSVIEHEDSIAIGYSAPANNEIDFHFAVSTRMPRRDPPLRVNERQNWSQWIDRHFVLRDSRGQRIALRRLDFSDAIPAEVAGTPEFFVIARLRCGRTYTLDYIPVALDAMRWRHTFTAPSAPIEATRVTLSLVEG